jgi:hypothetical protein
MSHLRAASNSLAWEEAMLRVVSVGRKVSLERNLPEKRKMGNGGYQFVDPERLRL